MGRGVGRFWRGPGRSTGEDLLGSADGGGRINLLLSFSILLIPTFCFVSSQLIYRARVLYRNQRSSPYLPFHLVPP